MNVRDFVTIYVAIASTLFFCVTALFILYCCYMERAVDSSLDPEVPQLRVNRVVPLADFTSVVVMQEYDDEETSFGNIDHYDGGIL